MPGPSRELQLRLYRDSLTTPWGFRLQGGKDLNSSLSIQKVVPCSPSDGELQRGDVLLEIQSNDARRLTHAQAQELIRKAGGSLLLRLARTSQSEYMPAPSVPALSTTPHRPSPRRNIQAPVNRDFGTDYTRPKHLQPTTPVAAAPSYTQQPSFMLSRVQDSLSGSLRNRTSHYPTVTDFYDLGYPKSAGPAYSPARASPIHSAPSTPSNPGGAPWRRAPQFRQAVADEPPAWLGSLRSSSNPLGSDSHAVAAVPHTPKIQGVHYGADGTPQYRQSASEGVESDTARAVHLQYNSPLGLYSRENAQQAMSGQLNGRAGEGTIAITTETQRMIQEQESGHAAARHDDIQQSPSIRNLSSQLEHAGTSDF